MSITRTATHTSTTKELVKFQLTEDDLIKVLEHWARQEAAAHAKTAAAGQVPAVVVDIDVAPQGFLRGVTVEVIYTKIEEKEL